MDRQSRYAATSQVILAVLAVILALHWLRPILMPIAVALVLACILSPVATFFRRRFPFGPLGAVLLLLLLALGDKNRPHAISGPTGRMPKGLRHVR